MVSSTEITFSCMMPSEFTSTRTTQCSETTNNNHFSKTPSSRQRCIFALSRGKQTQILRGSSDPSLKGANGVRGFDISTLRMKILKKFNKTRIDLVCPRSARHDHLENLGLILWGLCRILLHRYHFPYGRSCYCLLL